MTKRLIRAVISLALLVFLFSRTDIGQLADALKKTPLAGLTLFLALNVIMVLINSYRWKRLLSIKGLDMPIGNLFTSYIEGIFFNNFLPGSIGGDIYRVVRVANGKIEMALSSVLMERLLGLFVLLPITLIGWLFLIRETSNNSIILYSEASMAIFIILLALFFRVKVLKNFKYSTILYSLFSKNMT